MKLEAVDWSLSLLIFSAIDDDETITAGFDHSSYVQIRLQASETEQIKFN